jgi:hypothetical protein
VNEADGGGVTVSTSERVFSIGRFAFGLAFVAIGAILAVDGAMRYREPGLADVSSLLIDLVFFLAGISLWRKWKERKVWVAFATGLLTLMGAASLCVHAWSDYSADDRSVVGVRWRGPGSPPATLVFDERGSFEARGLPAGLACASSPEGSLIDGSGRWFFDRAHHRFFLTFSGEHGAQCQAPVLMLEARPKMFLAAFGPRGADWVCYPMLPERLWSQVGTHDPCKELY